MEVTQSRALSFCHSQPTPALTIIRVGSSVRKHTVSQMSLTSVQLGRTQQRSSRSRRASEKRRRPMHASARHTFRLTSSGAAEKDGGVYDPHSYLRF